MTVQKYDHDPWISTYSGKKVFPWAPKAEDIELIDIAVALSRTPRFRGHTREFYSVAQHCVIASHMVPKVDALWALLHDAPEAYIGDLPKPLKQMLPDWERADTLLTWAVCQRFGLEPEMPESVIEVDRLLLVSEAEIHLEYHVDNWHRTLGVMPDPTLILDPWSVNESLVNFLERYAELTGIDLR